MKRLRNHPVSAFARLAARAVRALGLGRRSPASAFEPAPPIHAPYAPADIVGPARRFFTEPFAPESLPLAHAFARLADKPLLSDETYPQVDAARKALDCHSGRLPAEDGERIVRMALQAKFAFLAIEASNKGLYFPWVKSRALFADLYSEVDTTSLRPDDVHEADSLRALVSYASSPRRDAEEQARQLSLVVAQARAASRPPEGDLSENSPAPSRCRRL